MKLTAAMKAVVEEQRLGFIATVNRDGTPNLSPKGTFAVVDDEHIGYLDIRSPNTSRNIGEGSAVEINFVDPFLRKGFRFFGHAIVLLPADEGFDIALSRVARWQQSQSKYRAIVNVEIERAAPLISPVYDRGATEDEVRRNWTDRFRGLQPGGQFQN